MIDDESKKADWELNWRSINTLIVYFNDCMCARSRKNDAKVPLGEHRYVCCKQNLFFEVEIHSPKSNQLKFSSFFLFVVCRPEQTYANKNKKNHTSLQFDLLSIRLSSHFVQMVTLFAICKVNTSYTIHINSFEFEMNHPIRAYIYII